MRTLMTTVFAVALGIGVPVMAQSPADQAVKARQANMKAITATMKELTDQQRTRATDWNKVAASAAKLQAQAKAMPSWFAGGAQNDESKTKPAAFSDAAGFNAEMMKFAAAANSLAPVAKSKSKDNLTTQMDMVRQSCVSCHNKFREKS